MLNQVVMVGRLAKDVEFENADDDKKVAVLTLAVPRPFKNEEGAYDTDFIDCVLWNAVATNTSEYCKKGDIIGVKGRVQSDEDRNIQIIAEKVTFLSSKKNDEE